jgi:hypothetical protein
MENTPRRPTLGLVRGRLNGPLGNTLRECEERIRQGETEGLLARWEFGKALLRRREGKQLPRLLLDAIVVEHNVSRREVQYRVQFAETFPTEDEVRTAVHTFGSWTEIRTRALPKPRADVEEQQRPEPSLDDLAREWLNGINTLMMKGAKFAEAAEAASADGVLVGAHTGLALLIYQRMVEKQLDAEIRAFYESEGRG